MRRRIVLLATLVAGLATGPALGTEIDDAIAAIKSVKREGAGNSAAAEAWKTLVKRGPAALPAILTAYDGADATQANWLRAAVDAIAEAEQQADRKLPANALESFFADVKRDPRARTIALDLLTQADPAAKGRLLAERLDDPSAGVRREAVAFALEKAGKDKAALQHVFAAARDVDQIEAIAKQLKDAGAEPDGVAKFGFITKWLLCGPFDNAGLKGFAARPPEKAEWKEFAMIHSRGMVDLYTAFNKPKGVNKAGKKDAVYAFARVDLESPAEQPAQIRIGSQNAIKIYLNGQEVYSRDEYHHGTRIDQHIAPVTLKQGVNQIVLNVCQDDMAYEWCYPWSFQLRITDAIGTPISLKQLSATSAVAVPPAPEPKKEPTK
ncbi:MAG: hypothetical protein ACJ8F7_22555 [Gemmataceae bacterium]